MHSNDMVHKQNVGIYSETDAMKRDCLLYVAILPVFNSCGPTGQTSTQQKLAAVSLTNLLVTNFDNILRNIVSMEVGKGGKKAFSGYLR